MERPRAAPLLTLLVAAIVVLFDQGAKWLVTDRLGPGGDRSEVALLGPALTFRYVENTGAAFGLLRGQGVLLSVLALVVIGGIVLAYRHISGTSLWRVAAIGLVAGGAVGNLIDRVRLGHVVDFVSVGAWPTFNLADSAITVGVVGLSFLLLVTGPEQSATGSGRAKDGGQRRSTLPVDG